jgi:hypothetical protein
VWWTLGFVVLTTTAIGLLTWGLLIMHAMTYGTFEVLRPQAGVIAPEFDNYVSAFFVGVTVNVAVALALVCLANRTRAQRWHPITVGFMTAVVAAVAAGSALLLVLGINPVSFLLAL